VCQPHGGQATTRGDVTKKETGRVNQGILASCWLHVLRTAVQRSRRARVSSHETQRTRRVDPIWVRAGDTCRLQVEALLVSGSTGDTTFVDVSIDTCDSVTPPLITVSP
jgi:hypothetical protein